MCFERNKEGSKNVKSYHVWLTFSTLSVLCFPPLSSALSLSVLCKALEERLKQEQREEVHALKEAHRRTLEILRQQSEQELQTLRYELEDEGKAKLGV